MKGESTEALLPNMVATSLAKLPIPKLMRWGASDVHFVRPVHTVTLLLATKSFRQPFWAFSPIA
ncbi:glycine-tRNA synthetase, beta subunit [Escherichia coli]|uniref:Glycine-tRNA synthetase, beta subunit n=1 Tax=Escherichia coli TaxID=562 RepID=A0A2X1NMB7_ECOLX|nr:glycine-tRNA synthetase, beta subunit [Escherichia coli]